MQKSATSFRVQSSKLVMQPNVSIRPLKFECHDCGSVWLEEIFFTSGTIVFKKPPCPKCGEDGTLGRSIAA